MSINENFEEDSDNKPLIKNLNHKGVLYQKQSVAHVDYEGAYEDVIPEQKSLNGSSFEQVSMGSLGASDNNELNIDAMLKDAQQEFD